MLLNPTLIHILASASTACPGGGNTCDTGLPTVAASSTTLQHILQLTIGILAGVAVLFVVIGGLRMVLSEGNPEDTSRARDTIIYAVVGLVICISAEAFVSFVLDKL